jgi:hypothetical protein
MKNFIRSFLTLAAIFAISAGYSQNLKERAQNAEKIYVEPLKFADYFAVKIEPKINDPEYNYWEPVDVGREYSGKADKIKIVGAYPVAKMEALNQKVIDRCKEFFGEDKVEPWPEDKFRDDKNDIKEKGVDADFYVVFRRNSWLDPFLISKKSEGSGRLFYFNERTEGLELRLYEVVKEGKSGKSRIKTDVSLYDRLDGVQQYIADVGDVEPGLVDDLLDDFYPVMDKAVDDLLDKFFTEIEEED